MKGYFLIIFCPILVAFSGYVVVAQETTGIKSGFQHEQGFGGPTSVTEQLRDDHKKKDPAFRFPAFDRFFTPWFNWKSSINEKYSLQLGFDYNALYQAASVTLDSNEGQAASGAVRIFGKWKMLGRETSNPGNLVFKIENRHRIGTDIPPSQLGFEVGYQGLTGTLFSDVGTVLVDLNWQQVLNKGGGGLIVGRYDPNDYVDVSGHANPWTTFSNLAVLVNTSIALPDSGFGIGGGHWIKSDIGDLFVLGSISDANGVIDEVEFFEGGSEFFTALEVGWTPDRSRRFTDHVHVTGWHVDERQDAGISESEGITIGANWTVIEDWMVFGRAGWSDGLAPLMNRTATIGFMKRFLKRDLLGLGFNWGDPSDDELRDQYSTEVFYRFQLSENCAITPSIQWLVKPANNPYEDQIWISGLRARISL